jgi:CBS domain-containing protein
MKLNLDPFVVLPESNLKEALSAIDANKRGFLLVCSSDATLKGVLTDGDIRRNLIHGGTLNTNVGKVSRNDSHYVTIFVSTISDRPQSFQEHEKRDEYWVLIKGNGKSMLGKYTKEVREGVTFSFPGM